MKTSGILTSHLDVRSSYQPDASKAVHAHEELYEIMMLEEGTVTQIQPHGRDETMIPGGITFAPPGKLHGSYSQDGSPCRFYLIYIHPQILDDRTLYLRQIRQFIEVLEERAEEDFFVLRRAQYAEVLLQTMQAMVMESRQQWSNQQEQLGLLLGQWFNWVLRDTNFDGLNILQKELHPHQRWMMESVQYMRTQYNRSDLKVGEVMERIPVSRSQFFQLFKREVGKTFSEKLNEIRMEEASRMLEKTQLPITEILYRVGYQNPSHFGHLFRENFGCSPREYRKRTLAD